MYYVNLDILAKHWLNIMKEFRSSVFVSKARVKPHFVAAKSSHGHLAILWISAQNYTCIASYKPGLDVNMTVSWAPDLVFEMAWNLWDPVALWMCSRMRFAPSTRSRRTPALWSRWREREVILSSSCRPWEASSSGQDSRYQLHNTKILMSGVNGMTKIIIWL